MIKLSNSKEFLKLFSDYEKLRCSETYKKILNPLKAIIVLPKDSLSFECPLSSRTFMVSSNKCVINESACMICGSSLDYTSMDIHLENELDDINIYVLEQAELLYLKMSKDNDFLLKLIEIQGDN